LFAAEGQEKGTPVSKIVQASDDGSIGTISALRGRIHLGVVMNPREPDQWLK
jgi:hypothetical protein